MIAGLLLKLPWLARLIRVAVVPLKFLFEIGRRNPTAALLILVLVWQVWSSRQQAAAFRDELRSRDQVIATQIAAINSLKDDNARLNGSIRQLTDMVAKLPVGGKAVVEIPKPQFIPVPGPVRIQYIREPGRIVTKVDTITLQPKEIEKIIDNSPQTIIAEFTATRDIKAGEKFRLIAAQVSPGVYQPILELGAPVTVDVRTVTPIDKIPAPTIEPSKFSGSLYMGYGTTDRLLLGVRVNYRLDNRWSIEGQAECRNMFERNPTDPEKRRICGGTDYRVATVIRF